MTRTNFCHETSRVMQWEGGGTRVAFDNVMPADIQIFQLSCDIPFHDL